mgnify:CR=1 FL=1
MLYPSPVREPGKPQFIIKSQNKMIVKLDTEKLLINQIMMRNKKMISYKESLNFVQVDKETWKSTSQEMTMNAMLMQPIDTTTRKQIVNCLSDLTL